jgi:hypothetical protein
LSKLHRGSRRAKGGVVNVIHSPINLSKRPDTEKDIVKLLRAMQACKKNQTCSATKSKTCFSVTRRSGLQTIYAMGTWPASSSGSLDINKNMCIKQ